VLEHGEMGSFYVTKTWCWKKKADILQQREENMLLGQEGLRFLWMSELLRSLADSF